MQVFHICESRAIIPAARELASLRYTLEDLFGPEVKPAEGTGTGGRARFSARRLSQLIPEAELRCRKVSDEELEFVFSYQEKTRVPEFTARERRYRTITYILYSQIIWRTETGLCFIVDLPRRALKATLWLLSAAVVGYPGRVYPYSLDLDRMRKVMNYLTSPSRGGPGEIIRTIFRDVRVGRSQIEEINLKARELNKLPFYREVEKGAGHIHAISFTTPIIEGVGRALACRMDSQGTVQIYSPRLPAKEFRALLRFFEDMLRKED